MEFTGNRTAVVAVLILKARRLLHMQDTGKQGIDTAYAFALIFIRV